MAKSSSPSAAATEGEPSPPVFIDTSLDTHLAMIVSPRDTVADLKRKVSLEHVTCFPNIGDITVRSMKVRRKATYYHLSDSMLVRTAFDGIKGAWFLHIDVAPPGDSGDNVAGGDADKVKWGVTNGPSSVDGLVKTDSTVKLNGPSPRLEPPSNDVLLISERRGEPTKIKSGTIRSSARPESSATELVDRSHVVNSENHETFFEANKVSGSPSQLVTDQLNKDVSDQIGAANPDDASAVSISKEKSRKRSMKLEDGQLSKPSSQKKRHKREEEKVNAVLCKDHNKDLLQVAGTENVVQEHIARDHTVGDVNLSADVCNQPLKDDSALREELPNEKKKRKKKSRKGSDECHDEVNAGASLNASDECKNLAPVTGPSKHTSNENDLALRNETIEHNHEKTFPISDNNLCSNSAMGLPNENDLAFRKEPNEHNLEKIFPISDHNLGSNSAMGLSNEKIVEDCTNEHHTKVDFEVPVKAKKKIAHRRRKKVTQDDVPNSVVGNPEIDHSLENQINGENLEVPADDPKNLATKVNREIVPEEASRQGNAVEILPEALPVHGRSSSCGMKGSCRVGSSEVHSSKDGAVISAANIEETVLAGNFMEADSSVPNTSKSSTRSKKKSVKTKESLAEAPHNEDQPIAGPASSAEPLLTDEHAEASNEKAKVDVTLMPKATQQGLGLVNTKDGPIIKKSHGRKAQQSDTVNSDLVEPPKDLSMKQQSKSHKRKAANKPQVVQNDQRSTKSDLPHSNISPHLQLLEGPQDHQTWENHDEDIFTGNKLKKSMHHAEEKGSVDYLGTSSRTAQQETGGNSDNTVKKMNGNPAASDDSTEEDTHYNGKRYRVAVRKRVSKNRSKKDQDKSKQEVFLNVADNIFDHSTSNSSLDEVEGHNGKGTSRNVSDYLTSDDSEEDLEQAQVVTGPRAQMNTSSQGASPSSAHLLHKKEASDYDIHLSQTSSAAKKHISLGALLRSSHSYRKAKLTAQSQADDAASQPVDVVPETQPYSP